MKKFLKILALVLVVALFLGTFVFLYQKSRPAETVYQTLRAERRTLERTTVVTGTVEPRDEVLIKPQISGIIAKKLASRSSAAKSSPRSPSSPK